MDFSLSPEFKGKVKEYIGCPKVTGQTSTIALNPYLVYFPITDRYKFYVGWDFGSQKIHRGKGNKERVIEISRDAFALIKDYTGL
jgi:hypothetical protein